MTYPLMTAFHTWLRLKGSATPTINNYDSTLNHFFNFLENQQGLGGQDALTKIRETDLRAFFNSQAITQGTYNKQLSHLNQYFLFLVDHQVINSYPTLSLHGKGISVTTSTDQHWMEYVPQLLDNDDLSMYTRVVLLLLAHGFDIQEIISPQFYELFVQLHFNTPQEQNFQSKYQTWIKPLQYKQNADELLLKQRINHQNPRLTLAGLHKYLKADQLNVPFKLAPQKLHQSYILRFIKEHPDWSQQRLSDHLRLAPSSIMYYQKLLVPHHP